MSANIAPIRPLTGLKSWLVVKVEPPLILDDQYLSSLPLVASDSLSDTCSLMSINSYALLKKFLLKQKGIC